MASEWFSVSDAPMSDVIVSTRVRLLRNLTGFLFPDKMNSSDKERVVSLVKDALNGREEFNVVHTENLTENALSFLEERGIRADDASCVAISPTGDAGILVNDRDHVRIVTFAAGLDVQKAVQRAQEIDASLQEKLTFVVGRERGYLASALKDAGSGMKISVRVHVPSIVYCGKAEIFVEAMQIEDFDCEAVYHDYNESEFCPYDAIGAYYDVSITSPVMSETDLMAKAVAQAKHIADLERKFRGKCTDNSKTLVRDMVIRDAATVKVASFMDEREAEEIISSLKWGVDMGILTGATDKSFARLNYFVRDAHVDTAMQGANFKMEDDIKGDSEMKRNRIRAVVMNGTLSSVNVTFSAFDGKQGMDDVVNGDAGDEGAKG